LKCAYYVRGRCLAAYCGHLLE